MNCILPTSKLYKDLSNLTDNSQPLIAYLNDVISMYQNEGFITQNRFKPDTGKVMYTVPKVIMEDSISAWLKGVGKGFKKDAKTKEKFEFVLSENSHNSFVKIKEFDKVIIVEFLAPDPDMVIPEELDLNDLIDEIELTEEQISEEALAVQEENENRELIIEQPVKEEGQLSLFNEEEFNQKLANFAELQPFEKKIIDQNKDEDLDIQCKL